MCNAEEGKGKEENNMAVLSKPCKISLMVREDKTLEFLSLKRDTKSMLDKFMRLKKIELDSGVSPSDRHIVFLDKKIKEFEEELKR